jgi:LAGLIDADG endonuclease
MLLRVLRVAAEAANRARGAPSFSLSLNEKDLELLRDLQAFFGCGWIRESKTDRTFKYEARAVDDLRDPITPHFERHPLRGAKRVALGRSRAFAG